MRLFKRKSDAEDRSAVATIDPRGHFDDLERLSDDELRGQISSLSLTERPDLDDQRRLLALRHVLGTRLLDAAGASPSFATASDAPLPEADVLPEFSRDEVTPEVLRAAILRDGCLLIRGLIPRAHALQLADGIDAAFAARETQLAGGEYDRSLYDPFVPEARYGDVPLELRGWVREGGGVLAGDAPGLALEMLRRFEDAGLPKLIGGYLGEAPLISLEKTTLRKASPSVKGAWHQDGHFMGPVRAANVWLSLSRCGDESPGLDVVPRRLDELVTAGGEGSLVSYQVFDEDAERVAAPKAVARPIFEPGDVLIFDELFLHQTASDPSMPKPRFAVESWFFGASAFPAAYAPFAV